MECVPQTAHHYWTLFLKSISRLLLYIFLFLTEHNPSFTLFLIYSSFFFTQSELPCSYKVYSYIKKCNLPVTLLKRESNIEIFKNSFFYTTPPVAASVSSTILKEETITFNFFFVDWGHNYAFKRQPHKMVKHTQTIHRQQATNCLSVFDHFVMLVPREL